MAQINDKNATHAEGGSSLADFNFDSDEQWFGMGGEDGKSSTDASTVTKAAKAANNKPKTETGSTFKEVAGEDDEEEQEEEHTFFADPIEKKDVIKKKNAPAKKKDDDEPEQEEGGLDDEDDDELDDVVDIEDEKGKKKGKKTLTENVENEEDEEGDETKEEDDKFYNTLVEELKEKGILQNIEVKKGEVITEEQFFELHDAEIESRVTETLEAMSENMDDDGKRFIKFKANGGNTADFMAIAISPINFDEKFDESDPKQVEKVLRHYYTTKEEMDAEELADKLQWLRDGGKEKATALKHFNKMKDEREKALDRLEKETEKKRLAKEDEVQEFNEALLEVLGETEQIGVIKITKQDQKELGSYMTKPLIKTGKNKYIPQMQAELMKILSAKTKEDKQRLIALSKAIKSNFDIKELAKDTTTQVTRKVKSKLQEAKQSVKSKTSGNSQTRALTDYF